MILKTNLKKVAFLGGDLRQVYMANQLAGMGVEVVVYALSHELLSKKCLARESPSEAIKDAQVVIAPIPMSKDGVEFLQRGQILYGGCISKEIEEICHSYQVTAIDFMKIEEVVIFNTIATAEGAIFEAIKNYPSNLHGCHCLVIGYGKCAKTLAHKLKGMSVKVCICARNGKARAEAESYGFETCSFDDWKGRLDKFDLLFNTVPAKVLKEEELNICKKDSVIIDIASSPGGVDFDVAKKLERKAKLCLALPGKYSPKASAEKLLSYIIEDGGKNGD